MDVAEIQITRPCLVDDTHPRGCGLRLGYCGVTFQSFELLYAADVVRAVHDLPARGAALVTIDSGGGSFAAAEAIGDALRAYSAAGGQVVAYVARMAGSTAVEIAVAADVVLMHPAARFVIHSAAAQGYDEAETERLNQRHNERTYRLLAARTCAPPELLGRALAQTYDPAADKFRALVLGAPEAVALGFADAVVGDAEEARSLAAAVADGFRLRSPRQARLETLRREAA